MEYIDLELPTEGFTVTKDYRGQIVIACSPEKSPVMIQLAAQMEKDDIRAFIAMIGVEAVESALKELKD